MVAERRSYAELLEESLPPKGSPLYKLNRDYALRAIDRGGQIADILERSIPVEGAKVLDMGCGEGGVAIAFALRGAEVTALDVSPGRIERMKVWASEHNVHVNGIVADSLENGLPDSHYDIVISNDFMEHVSQPQGLAYEIERLLKDGGYLYLSNQNRLSIFGFLKDPHLGLFGITWMPRWLARIYAERIRRRTKYYTVFVIPTHRYLKKIFSKTRVELTPITSGNPAEKIANPDLIKVDTKRKLVVFAKKLGLTKIALWLLGSRFSQLFLETLEYVGKKERMSGTESSNSERGAWNAAKGLLWKILSLGGGKSADKAWMTYSLVRAFVDANIKESFTGEAEEDFVRKSVKAGQVCLDIGSSIGGYTHLLSKLVGDSGQVHSVEPIASAFAILMKRVALFRLKNVRCHQVALGEHMGVGEFVGGTGRPGSRSLAHLKAPGVDEGQAIQKISLLTLDRLVANQKLERIDFVKCDVEGSELMVFRGGQNVLTKYRPIVLCEIEERWMRYGHTTEDVVRLFSTLKYSLFVWREGRLSAVNEVSPQVNNYILIPHEYVYEILNEFHA